MIEAGTKCLVFLFVILVAVDAYCLYLFLEVVNCVL